MRNYLDKWQTCIEPFDLELYSKAKEALDRAMRHYNDFDMSNYFIILVEGYKCIAHTSDEWEPIELDCIIFPFDDNKVYPMQGLKTVYEFDRSYKDED